MAYRSMILAGMLAAAPGMLLATAGGAAAATVKYQATLTPTSEVPPTKSTGSGQATVALDTVTHQITYDVTFSGFSSDVVAGHIHGPAAVGKNAGVLVPFASPVKSPLHGTATLTATQQKALQDGMTYVNIHTKNNPNGAIRGQLTAAP